MIGRLRGILLEKQAPDLLIEVAGVGYEVQLPLTSFYQLPAVGIEATIYTHFVVREDAQLLYGFANPTERSLFRQLIKANGIGPKMALTILSGLTATQFVRCVQQDDISTLVKLPGVGKKTAERLLLELKGKFGADIGLTGQAPQIDSQLEVLQALTSLGYSDKEAQLALKQVTPGSSVSDGIRLALKALSKA